MYAWVGTVWNGASAVTSAYRVGVGGRGQGICMQRTTCDVAKKRFRGDFITSQYHSVL